MDITLHAFLRIIPGATGIPLAYVFRENNIRVP